MKIFDNGIYREMTAEEIAAMEREIAKTEAIERNRPLTYEEVNVMLISAQINTIPADDNTALRMKDYYPEWATNTSYALGFKVKYNNRLYKAIQAHTSQEGWQPDVAASLWTEISEIHAGTLEDPIPYNNNMALESGKYYYQDYKIYLCTRDTVNPVYSNLSDLVELYVEEI
jgi:hypothetical protein